jgi:hypothetical protein
MAFYQQKLSTLDHKTINQDMYVDSRYLATQGIEIVRVATEEDKARRPHEWSEYQKNTKKGVATPVGPNQGAPGKGLGDNQGAVDSASIMHAPANTPPTNQAHSNTPVGVNQAAISDRPPVQSGGDK